MINVKNQSWLDSGIHVLSSVPVQLVLVQRLFCVNCFLPTDVDSTLEPHLRRGVGFIF